MIEVTIYFRNNERMTFLLDTSYNFSVRENCAYLYNGDTDEEYYYPLANIIKIIKSPVDSENTKWYNKDSSRENTK